MATKHRSKKHRKVTTHLPAPKHRASHHGIIPAWAKSPTPVPPALLQAIYRAAKKYNVPPDVLAGIWRGESASTYPNPAVNNLGYGGLFGTKLWNGSTQAQADYAASILHNALVTTKGNLGAAINIYQTGRTTSRSYSPPGADTSGTVAGYGGGGTPINLGKFGSRPAPGTLGTGKSVDVGGAILGAPGKAIDAIFGVVTSPIEEAAFKVIDAFSIIGGGFIFIFGFALVAADIGLSSRASNTVNQIPLAATISRAGTKISRSRSETSRASAGTSQVDIREKERREEMHRAKLATEAARTKKAQAQATESRTRQKNRRRTKAEQEKAEKRAYIHGARDVADPTMTKIRRERERRERKK